MSMTGKHRFGAAAALGLLALMASGTASLRGQDEKKPGLLGPWGATAELSYVVTGGNAATSAFSLGASLSTHFIFDENLKEMNDWRFDWTSSATASISRSLALKISLRMLYAHLPALQDIPLFDLDGLPTGLTVGVSLNQLDTFLTTSIVINF